MPWHVHPAIRALEEFRESVGLIQTLDSVGVTEQKAVEASGAVIKAVPNTTIYAHGTNYKPK